MKVKYRLLDGSVEIRNRTENPAMFREGDWVSQKHETPSGLFVIALITPELFTLEQIDCSPQHWAEKNGHLPRGRDETCPTSCKFYDNCRLTESREYESMVAIDGAE